MKYLITIFLFTLTLSIFAQEDEVSYQKESTSIDSVSNKTDGYQLVTPTRQIEYSDDDVYYQRTNQQTDIYADEWKRENPTYNRLIAEQYRNNSTSPFESEARQLQYMGHVALTSTMLQFLSATPYLKVY